MPSRSWPRSYSQLFPTRASAEWWGKKRLIWRQKPWADPFSQLRVGGHPPGPTSACAISDLLELRKVISQCTICSCWDWQYFGHQETLFLSNQIGSWSVYQRLWGGLFSKVVLLESANQKQKGGRTVLLTSFISIWSHVVIATFNMLISCRMCT